MNIVYFFISLTVILLAALICSYLRRNDVFSKDYTVVPSVIALIFINSAFTAIGGLVLVILYMMNYSLFDMPDCGCEHIGALYKTSVAGLSLALFVSYISNFWKSAAVIIPFYTILVLVQNFL